MTQPFDYFAKYKQYPTASYEEVKEALQKLGYNLNGGEDGEFAYFKVDLNNPSERPVEVQTIEKIPPLTLYMIADNNDIDHDRFSTTLWQVINIRDSQ